MLQRACVRRTLPAGNRSRRRGGYLAEPGGQRKALALLASLLLWSAYARAEAPVLLSHEATYELALAERAGSGISGARGVLVVTVQQGCDAWFVRQGVALTVAQGDEQVSTVSDFDSREALDGSRYTFEERTTTQPGLEEVWAGTAELGPDGGRASLAEPERDEGVLPAGTVFPTAHLIDILRRARNGERFMSHVLFDGTEGLALFDVTSVVGAPEPAGADGMMTWPLRLAFFAHGAASEVPELEVSARVRGDGVAEALTYDYGSFVLAATLTGLQALPAPDC